MRTRVYKRDDDPIWPWGYYVEGQGYFVTDSRKDAERKVGQWENGERPEQQYLEDEKDEELE